MPAKKLTQEDVDKALATAPTAVDPNVNATARSVSDKLDGEVDGKPLPYDLVDQLETAEKFSLSGTVPGVKPVAYTEGENVSSSFVDHTNTLTKVWARKYLAEDGKLYDPWDALMEILDYVLAQKATPPTPAQVSVPAPAARIRGNPHPVV